MKVQRPARKAPAAQWAFSNIVWLSLLTAACAPSQSKNEEEIPQYHADNDIAMTVCSLADAITLKEDLDSTEYNFDGILTDGQGMPLYTDWQGAPGMWEVSVLSPHRAVVRNVNTGDIFPTDLIEYVVSNLGLSEDDRVETTDLDDDDDAYVNEYAFENGRLRFEVRRTQAPNGLESCLFAVIVTAAK